MTLQTLTAFVAAVMVLMVIPGPNVALIVANSVAHGVRFGLLTVAGTSAAMVIQLGLTAFGMSAGLTMLSGLFGWLRWVGVAYLVGLGLRAWFATPVDLTMVRAKPRRPGAIVGRGFLVSLANPKTLLFYGAFLPQFVDPTAAPASQLMALSVTFVAVALVMDGGWALLAGRLRALLQGRGRLRNRATGGLLIGAGLGLALARRP